MQAEHTLSLLHIGQWGKKVVGMYRPEPHSNASAPPVASIT